MTDLILKGMNGVAKQKSYGGNTLETNLKNADIAISKVQYTERIWDRARSQWSLKFLTCCNGDAWTRLRQVSAEMFSKRSALSTAKFNYLKDTTKAKIKRSEMAKENDKNKKKLLEIEANELEFNASDGLVKVEGALKECETLADLHDALKLKIGEVTEEAFESEETKAQIRRVFSQSVREVKECGTIRCGNSEYMEQIGICTAEAFKDIRSFIEQEDKSRVIDTSMLQDFLEFAANKYEVTSIQKSKWLGYDVTANPKLTYLPEGA